MIARDLRWAPHMKTQTLGLKNQTSAPRRLTSQKNRFGSAKVLFQKLGPGLITGASDDDPSGIGTYSQVGAQFGYGLLWTMVFLLSADDCDSGNQRAYWAASPACGIAANLTEELSPSHFSIPCSSSCQSPMFSIWERILARWARRQLAAAGKTSGIFIVLFGLGSLAGVLLVPYSRYAKYLKWLTLSLFAYVGVVFFAHVPWRTVLRPPSSRTLRLRKGISDGANGGSRDHHQPLFIFLASFTGSGRGDKQSMERSH